MNHAELSGIDKALILGNAANTKLEYTAKPTLKDKKDSRDLFKRAYKILENVIGLEEEDIYETGPRPDDAFTDSTDHQIYLPVVAADPEQAPAELPPLPDDLLAFDTWDDTEQTNEFERRLEALRQHFAEDVELDWEPWENLMYGEEVNRKDAFTRLLVAEAREPKSWDVPTDEERDAWLAQFAPAAVPMPGSADLLNSWEGWTEEERKAQFDLHIETLTSLHAKQNSNQENPIDVLPFLEIFAENPFWAFCSVLFCLAQDPILFTYPDAQDVETWVVSLTGVSDGDNAADQDATFDAKLAELEEAGVKEGGLKRKAWKKAEKAWRDSYLMAGPWTLEALLWRLVQSSITWDVPTPEEMETPEIAHAVGEE